MHTISEVEGRLGASRFGALKVLYFVVNTATLALSAGGALCEWKEPFGKGVGNIFIPNVPKLISILLRYVLKYPCK